MLSTFSPLSNYTHFNMYKHLDGVPQFADTSTIHRQARANQISAPVRFFFQLSVTRVGLRVGLDCCIEIKIFIGTLLTRWITPDRRCRNSQHSWRYGRQGRKLGLLLGIVCMERSLL